MNHLTVAEGIQLVKGLCIASGLAKEVAECRWNQKGTSAYVKFTFTNDYDRKGKDCFTIRVSDHAGGRGAFSFSIVVTRFSQEQICDYIEDQILEMKTNYLSKRAA